MAEIKPFKIAVPDDKINRLKQKLALTDFPDEVSDEQPWIRGPPLADIKRLALKWLNDYDWRKAEAELNKLPQYITQVPVDKFGTYDFHFIHQRSSVKNAIPLLFVHGWPGSFIEVVKILPLLDKGDKEFPAFHVVAPSLMDFGFSSVSGKRGFQVDHHAESCHKLMLQLGYNEYVVQGGDLGYFIARMMAKYYPTHVRAHHINLAAPNKPTKESYPELYEEIQKHELTEWEKNGLARSNNFREEGMGYSGIHGTKPQTIGYTVTDSPVGLLAWVYEKLHDWSDHENYNWTDDEVLTWISIYQFSRPGPAATQRIYYEEKHRKPRSAFEEAAKYINVPLGISHVPKELATMPRLWHKTMGPIVFQKQWEIGGHFAAHEQPEMLVADLREMFGKGGGAYGVVKGCEGYDE